MGGYKRSFDKTKYISFPIEIDKLLEKYDKIWNKVSNVIEKDFDSKPVESKKYLKFKIKSYGNKKTITLVEYHKKVLTEFVFDSAFLKK